jgi:hypothetical protein
MRFRSPPGWPAPQKAGRRLTKQPWWPLVAWAGASIVGISATPLLGYVGGVELDSAAVESSIEDWYPEPILITVESWLGDVSWQTANV